MRKFKPNRVKSLSAFLLIVVLVVINGCSLFNDPNKTPTANEYIYSAFQDWYLWYDEIPEIDPNDYETYADLIDAISVEQDRWSFAGSYTEIMKLFEGGEYTGFGASFIIDFDSQIKLSLVYSKSPMGRIGAQRGWVVESINGYTTSDLKKVNEALASNEPVTFVLLDLDGNTITEQLQKEAFQMNTVLYSNVYNYDEKKVGYFVYSSFTKSSEEELNSVIEEFHNQQITDLVVDLRYNGGGLNTIANMLIGAIGGEKVDGQIISKITHNDKKADKNSSVVSDYKGITLNLDKVYFITTEGTASASELLINCLTPFMDVKLIGSNTHGKPVGMYILSVTEIDLGILPISFKNVNHDDYGDYFEGFEPDILEVDDLTHTWGDTEELMLKAALNDITNPTAAISSIALKSERIRNQKQFDYKGINQLINAY